MWARRLLQSCVPALAVLVSLPCAATTIVVNSGEDVEGPPWVGVPSRCAAGSTLPCRMRDAVAAAQGGDRIVFGPGITEIALGRTLKFGDTSGLPVTVEGEGRVSFLPPLGTPTLRMMGPHTNVVVLRGLTIPGARSASGAVAGWDGLDNCGGAILNQGDLSLERITLPYGFAKFGGLICNFGELRIAQSTLTLGQAVFSAGAIMNSGTLEVTNSLISESSAQASQRQGNPSNPFWSGAGAVFNRNGTADFNFVTLFENRGYLDMDRQRLGHSILNACGDLRVRNSVLLPTFGMGLSVGRYPCFAHPTRVENSLFALSSQGVELPLPLHWDDGGRNIHSSDTRLAVDAVPCVDAPATDLRGVRRPQGAACDMGAFEQSFDLFADGFESGAATAAGGQP